MSTLKRSEREPALEEAAAGLATPIANGRTPRSGETKSGLLRTGWRGASRDQTHCSWLSALGVRGLPSAGANFVRLGHCGAGDPELLSARSPPRPFEPCDALGRSQVVRQRILIPPSGGSNPPAPAKPQRVELFTETVLFSRAIFGPFGNGFCPPFGTSVLLCSSSCFCANRCACRFLVAAKARSIVSLA
jgi:hypothetical protein